MEVIRLNEESSKVAILIPCRNEEISIEKVVSGFRKVLPDVAIYIGDNNSTDRTASLARELDCEVIFEYNPGKGHMLRHLIRDVEADYYVIVDGDDTYDPGAVVSMLELIKRYDLDMVISRRVTSEKDKQNERSGHLLGNRTINIFFNILFNSTYRDVLSGYRVLSSNFAKSFPSKSNGFEIEVELNAHANWMNASVMEFDSGYKSRVDGSESKLRTFHDGIRIIKEIYLLNRRSNPMRHFKIFYTPLIALALGLVLRAVVPYLDSGKVENLPSLLVGMSLLTLNSVLWSSFLVMEQANSHQLSLVNLLRRKAFKCE